MTDFNDVTRTFTEGLDQIAKYIPQFIAHLQAGDKAFRQHKDDLTGQGHSIQIHFYGMGASAFAASVEHNIARVKSFVDDWNTLAKNSADLLAQITRFNNEANSKLYELAPSATYLPLEQYNDPAGMPYTAWTIWREMGEAALKSSDMNTVMDQGELYFTDKLDTLEQDIIANITTQHNRKMNQFKSLSDPNANTEELYYIQARDCVNALRLKLSDVIITWFREITPLLRDYDRGMSTNKVLVPAYTPPGTQYIIPMQGKLWGIPYHGKYVFGPTGSATPWDPSKGNEGVSGNVKMVFSGLNDFVLGNDQWGLTGGGEIDGPSFDYLAGKTQDGTGAKIDAGLLSGNVNVGLNIAGANVGVTASAGIQVGFGVTLKKDALQVNVPFYSYGFTWGQAKK